MSSPRRARRVFGNNRPVRLDVGSSRYYNIDPPVGGLGFQGNVRFRHDNETQCNVAFADGSVRPFTAVVRIDRTVQSHDALRRCFMISWPPGVMPDLTQPH